MKLPLVSQGLSEILTDLYKKDLREAAEQVYAEAILKLSQEFDLISKKYEGPFIVTQQIDSNEVQFSVRLKPKDILKAKDKS